MYNSPAVTVLRDDIARRRLLDEEALRDEVCAVVDELKAAGWPPERVIIAVKRVADDAGLRASRAVLSTGADLTNDDDLLVRMVEWCIKRYYRAD